ncbi:MAG TPA: general secretion pathway protein GspK [Gammaproteobacteria bacterium]|nr:general secretion pathway protein GspK [Gammaproteobacteria bacterium]
MKIVMKKTSLKKPHMHLTRFIKPVRRHQQGVALLTALLIVAFATIIAVNIIERQQYDVQRLQNILLGQQAYLFALGGEAWAKSVLFRDKNNSNTSKTDNLFEDWAKPLPSTFIEGGTISGKINDLQGRFNINNLYIKDRNDLSQINRLKEQKALFERLLRVLEISNPISDAIIDWMDTDADVTFPRGAEDQNYLEKSAGYRAGNKKISNITELLLVEGITARIYKKLEPYICALPEQTTININTAPAEVIAALSDQLDLEKAISIVENRTSAFDTVKKFIDKTKGLTTNKTSYELVITPLIGVSSRYFEVQAYVQIDKIRNNLVSTLKRTSTNGIETLSRSPGMN